ncbi:unnamed protein product [Closterium sp. NIES-65]|nr:unnamed protein product [Closterium sp. NIES-65]
MVDLAMMSCVNKEDLRKLIPKELYPTWVQFPEFERVEWINYFLRELWPKLREAISGAVMMQIGPVLESYRPPMISSLKLTKFNLGRLAPQLGGIDVVETRADEVVLHVDFNWVGDPSIILAIKTVVGVALQVQVGGVALPHPSRHQLPACSFLSCFVTVHIFSLLSSSPHSPHFLARHQVKNLQIWGVFRVALTPLIPTIPCFGAIVFAFTKKPEVKFKLKVAGGDIAAVPGLGDAIDDLIRSAIMDSLVWPVRHVIPIVPGNYEYLQMRTVGVLEVKLVEGRDLMRTVGVLEVKLVEGRDLVNLSLLGTIDPYATLFVRPIPARTRRSRTIANSVNPLWNHSFEFTVEDPETQRLVIKWWDDQERSVRQEDERQCEAPRSSPMACFPLPSHPIPMHHLQVWDDQELTASQPVWDDQELTASQPVGQAAIVLADLPPLKLVDRWVPVVKDVDDPKADTRPRGSVRVEVLAWVNSQRSFSFTLSPPPHPPPLLISQLHLELLYRPVDENGVLLAPAYFTPPAPKTLQEATAAANAAEARKTRQAGVGFLSPIKAQQQEEGEEGGDVPAMALGGDQGGLGVEDGETKYLRGVLQVVLLSGRELVACDMNGLSDPFAVLELQLGGQRRKSQVVKKTLEPEWNENFEFLVEDGKHDMLVVGLFDHDLLGKKDSKHDMLVVGLIDHDLLGKKVGFPYNVLLVSICHGLGGG